MPFVPDTQQAQATGRFVPDATSQPDSYLTKARKAVESVAEPLLTMATGAVAVPAGNVMGAVADAYSGLTGQPLVGEDVAKWGHEKLTYAPRSEGGKRNLATIGKAFEESKLAGLPVVGNELQVIAGHTTPVAKALRSKTLDRNVPTARQHELLVEESRRNAPKLNADKRAETLGFRIPAAASTGKPTITENIGGVKNLAHDASVANQTTANQGVLRNVLRDNESTTLSPEAFAKAEARATEPYREIEAIPTIALDDTFKQRVANLDDLAGLTPEESALIQAAPEAQAEIQRLSTLAQGMDSVSGTGVVRVIRDLRQRSNDTLYGGSGQVDQANVAVARAQRRLADAMEDNIERSLGGDQLKRFQEGRTWYAQIQDVKAATNRSTQNFDPSIIAKRVGEGDNITGYLKDVGDIAAQYPEFMRSADTLANIPHVSYQSPASYAARGIAHYAAGLPGYAATSVGVPYLSSALRKRALSPEYIAKNRMKDYRPEREAMGYEAAPVPADLSLAEVGSYTPMGGGGGTQVPMNPNARGLDIGFADDVAARRTASEGGIPFEIEPRLQALYGQQPPPVPTLPSGPYQGKLPPVGSPDMPPVLPETPAVNPALGNLEFQPAPAVRPIIERTFDPATGRAAALRAKDRMPDFGSEVPLPELPPMTPAPRDMLDIGFTSPPESTPLSQQLRARHDVPTQEFPLRQEVLQQPEIVAATDAFRAQAADLQTRIAKASGFWKDKYQAELDALQQEFAAGMRQLGIDNPLEAIGTQKQYQGGVGVTKLPIEKTFTLEALRRGE